MCKQLVKINIILVNLAYERFIKKVSFFLFLAACWCEAMDVYALICTTKNADVTNGMLFAVVLSYSGHLL